MQFVIKSAQLNSLRATQIAQALCASVTFCSKKFSSADLFQTTREKLMWLLLNNIHEKICLCFPLSRVYDSLVLPSRVVAEIDVEFPQEFASSF